MQTEEANHLKDNFNSIFFDSDNANIVEIENQSNTDRFENKEKKTNFANQKI